MKRKYVSAMLSGLLFPGAGQITNKHYFKGGVVITLSIILFIVFLYLLIMGYVAAFNDKEAIYETVMDFFAAGLRHGGRPLLLSFLGLIGIWIYATVDALIFGDDEDEV